MNVLLLDDHPLVRSALEAVLKSLGEDVQVHAAATGAQAVRILQEQPAIDLALLDLGLPDVDGMQLLVQWRREHPDLRVVVISASIQPANVIRALDEGARGFIPKFTSNEVLLQALRMVLAGGIYVPPIALHGARDDRPAAAGPGTVSPLAHHVHERTHETALTRGGFAAADWTRPLQAALGGEGTTTGGDPPPVLPRSAVVPRSLAAAGGNASVGVGALTSLPSLRLTSRQAEVLQGLLQGQPNKLIARQLNLSVETVKDHVAALLRVLGVSSRTQAVLVVSQMMTSASGGGALPSTPGATARAHAPTEGARSQA